jgi:hypothetical protein
MRSLDAIAERGTDDIDLTHPASQPRVRELADALLDSGADTSMLRALGRDPDVGIDVRVATRLAESRRLVADGAIDVGEIVVQCAMWGEQRRLRPRDDDNPLGEDALRVKLDQLDWLLSDTDVACGRLYPRQRPAHCAQLCHSGDLSGHPRFLCNRHRHHRAPSRCRNFRAQSSAHSSTCNVFLMKRSNP